MADFTKDATPTAILFFPDSIGARRYIRTLTTEDESGEPAEPIGFYAKFWDGENDAVTFKLPTDKANALDFERNLIAKGYIIEEDI